MKIKYLNKDFEVSDNINFFQLMKELNVENSKNVVAAKTAEKIYNLTETITNNSNLEFIYINSLEGLEIIRHSTAHLFAGALKSLFPSVKFAIGPAIENQFYYDFDLSNNISENEFEKIEKQMNVLVKNDEKFIREEISKEEARKIFTDEPYKLELLESIPTNEKITIYRLGDFVDLCRGVHVASTRYLKYFKLTKIAGAYWRGDSKNKMLQRIYGTAWDTKESLDNYFTMLEEAEKRDHRKTCKSMDLAHFEFEYAPGAPFFHSNGLYLYNKLITHMREKQDNQDYKEISTPRVMDKSLWERSGHWEKYGEHNYSGKTEDEKEFCIKPMNCPGCILVYKSDLKSYRDLPLKISEFGKVNRYEASGALHGLLRVREFTQDDAHIFCTEEQLEDECREVIKFILEIYKDFGFEDVKIKLSTRPANRIGSEEIWDISEKALAETLTHMNLTFEIFEGEGAFYGPKLEFVLKDCIGRDWQCGTLQLDMNLPDRFDMNYIGVDGKKHTPIMLHRALLGSIERFLGVLIENTDGKFPLWLNPYNVAIATITEEFIPFADEVKAELIKAGIRVITDYSNEKIGYKIRELSSKKVPYIFSIGKRETEEKTVSVRTFGGNDFINLTIKDVTEQIKFKIKEQLIDFELKK